MKRFEVTLLIRHPDLDPGIITAKLGLQPHRAWKAGAPKVTPKGTSLAGSHSASCWNHVFRSQPDGNLSGEIDQILDHLMRNKELFRKIARTGGKSELFLKLPGKQNLGDELPWNTLQKFVDLKLALSLETFPKMRVERA